MRVFWVGRREKHARQHANSHFYCFAKISSDFLALGHCHDKLHYPKNTCTQIISPALALRMRQRFALPVN